MDKRYIAVAAVLVVASFAVFSYRGLRETQPEIEHPYKVYNGEEFLHDAYPYTFVFFGDNRPAEGKEQPETFKSIIQMINSDNPLFVIGGGDFVIEGTPENFEEFLNVVSHLNPPLFYVCGNHDDSPYYQQYLGERVYAFTYKNALFIVLDNSKKTLDTGQLAFLEEQLRKNFEHTFVFLHMPPFDPEGTHCMINPEQFMEIILQYNVDFVFCAHIHHFYQEKKGNTQFIISGGAGAPLHRGGYYHYITVHVKEDITYTVVRA